MDLTLTVRKADVYEQVAQTTAYTGAKIAEDPKAQDSGAYSRISTVDEDAEQLERFWQEAQAEACRQLVRVMASERLGEDDYSITITTGGLADAALAADLRASMEQSLRNYMVCAITAKWFTLANKGEAAEYAQSAAERIEDVKRKAFFRAKPAIPDYYKR